MLVHCLKAPRNCFSTKLRYTGSREILNLGGTRRKSNGRKQRREKKMDYKSQRSEAIQLAGAAQKKRQDASKALRMVDDNKVADLEACMAELSSRADNFQDMAAIKENDAMKLKQELLPQYDMTAADPQKIYARGLQRMLPEWILKAENGLRDDRMTIFLQSATRVNETSPKELEEVFKSRFGARLVQARAEAIPSELYEDAELTARRFSALNVLIKLCRVKRPRWSFAQFQAELAIPGGDKKLANHLFDYFMKEGAVDRRVRTINRKKLVCHLIVFVLDLSFRYKIDLQPMQDELHMDFNEMAEHARYVGCEIHKKSHPDNATQTILETQLKAPLVFPQKKGAGKRKRA